MRRRRYISVLQNFHSMEPLSSPASQRKFRRLGREYKRRSSRLYPRFLSSSMHFTSKQYENLSLLPLVHSCFSFLGLWRVHVSSFLFVLFVDFHELISDFGNQTFFSLFLIVCFLLLFISFGISWTDLCFVGTLGFSSSGFPCHHPVFLSFALKIPPG